MQAYEGDFIDMNLRRFFRGNRLSFTAESNDPTVATVSFITNDRLRVRITATATKADPSVTGVTVLCQQGESGVDGLTCGEIVHVTLPFERVTTRITMTATERDAGSVSARFDLTVFLDPNRE